MHFRFSRRLAFIFSCLLATLSVVPATQAQSPSARATATTTSSQDSAHENYDVRETDDASASSLAVRAGYRASQLTGPRAARAESVARNLAPARAALATRVPTLQTEDNRFATAPEIVGTATAAASLTAPSTAPREAVLRGFLAENAAVYGLTADEAAALLKFSDYANPAGNLSWVGLKQELNGLPVFQGELLAAFTPDGALARTTGNLAPGLDAASLPTAPALTPAQAAARAAASLGYRVDAARLVTNSTEQNGRVTYLSFGPFVREIKTELLYFPVEPGVAVLAYSMVLWEQINAYYILVDANDGTLLWRKNITQDQTQTATYNVYTGVSPTPLTPSTVLPGQGTQPAEVARTSVTLVADNLTASPLGWITDGGNATIGNNTTCGLDLNADDNVDGNVSGAGRVFSFNYNPAPGLSGAVGSTTPSDAAYRNGVVTNLFFWTNRYHDALYSLGFTEPARNFQTTNTFGGVSRGGLAGDPVFALAQDGAGVNNANFSTPSDGSSGVMRMYLFTNTTPNRDGSLDADVFLHEMTHGTSNRLHNNGSGLNTQQAGGMGEGWSDYYARCLLSRADEDVTGLFPSGGYVTYELGTNFHDNYYYGIREFPYAVKSSVGANGKPYNPLTFGNLDMTQTNGLSNGAYPSSPVIGIYASEVHNVGHFWCTTLLEMRARLIQRLGYAVGNQRTLQIVTDGMKLDGTNPTITAARDSIIAADNAAYGGNDVADIRSGFAARGMGAGSSITTYSTYFFTVVESFYPSSAAGAITFSDSLGNGNGVADPGEDLVFSVPLTNKLTVSDANVTASLGGAYNSSSYGTIAAGATVSKTFTYRVPLGAPAGTLLQIPLAVSSANGSVTVPVPVRVGTPAVVTELAQDFNATATGTLPAGWTQTGTVTGSTWSANATVIDSGNCAFAADVSTTSDSSLVSSVIALNGNANQQISFRQRYTFQTAPANINSPSIGYDGGVLEISVAGGAFTDIVTAGGSWVQGGYAQQVNSGSTGNPLIGRRAWSGPILAATTVVANLPAAAVGQNVQFRWRLGCGAATGSTGWYVDTVQVYSTAYSSTTIDADGDGIPDGYETLYGLNPNNPTDAAGDLDGDGVSNLSEYLAGTNPTSASSVLQVTQLTYDATTGLAISFPSVSGKVYVVEAKDDLSQGGWTMLPGYYLGDGTTQTLTFSPANLGDGPKRFFRVRVLLPI